MGSVYNERTVDILSALELSQLSLIGSPNIRRILLARLALTMADPKQLFQADQLNKICRLFVSIERLIDLSDTLQTLSSQSYLYWHHDVIIPIYLRDVIQVNETDDCENIQVILLVKTHSIQYIPWNGFTKKAMVCIVHYFRLIWL